MLACGEAESRIQYRLSAVACATGTSAKAEVSTIKHLTPLTTHDSQTTRYELRGINHHSPLTNYKSRPVETLASVSEYLTSAFGSHPGPKAAQSCPLDFAFTSVFHSISAQKIKTVCHYFFFTTGGTIPQIRHRWQNNLCCDYFSCNGAKCQFGRQANYGTVAGMFCICVCIVSGSRFFRRLSVLRSHRGI